MFEDDDIFGDLFDFDGDGEISFGEALIIHELFASDEELKLEYGEPDDNNAPPVDYSEDDELKSEYGEPYDDDTLFSDYGKDYHLKPKYCDPDCDDTSSVDYDNDDEFDVTEADTDDGTDVSLTVPINISFSFGSDDPRDDVKRTDYPNERAYKAAELLDSIERYPDIYGKTDYSKEIDKCRFILDNPNVTAAKYLNYKHGFLFAQAVKERFMLPITIPDDDEDIHTSFPELFRKLSRYNAEYAIRVWHWVLTMFSPYIKYGDDRDAEELTSFVMCSIEEKQLIAAAVYAEAHPHFITVFLNTMPELTCMIDNWICLCIKNNARNSAKALFEGCLSSKKTECDEKEIFVSGVIEKSCNSDESETIKFFRDALLPVVIKYADKPMRRKISEWQSDISEYIKENAENAEDKESKWRDNCAYMRRTGVEPNNYESEAECRRAYEEKHETERRRQKEQHDTETVRRQTLCRELENGVNVKQYIYCAVILPSVPRPYHYMTKDESVKIGDKVIVPIGEDNKDMTGTVVSVEYHTELTVPFPLDQTKNIIKKV